MSCRRLQARAAAGCAWRCDPLAGVQDLAGLAGLADGGIVRRELLIGLRSGGRGVAVQPAAAAAGPAAAAPAPGRSGHPCSARPASRRDRRAGCRSGRSWRSTGPAPVRRSQRQLGRVQAAASSAVPAGWLIRACRRLSSPPMVAPATRSPPSAVMLVAEHIRAHLGPGQPQAPPRVVQLGAHEQDALPDPDGAQAELALGPHRLRLSDPSTDAPSATRAGRSPSRSAGHRAGRGRRRSARR